MALGAAFLERFGPGTISAPINGVTGCGKGYRRETGEYGETNTSNGMSS